MHRKKLSYGLCGVSFLLLLFAKQYIEPKLEPIVTSGPSLHRNEARYHSRSLKLLSLGFDNVLADLIWIRLVHNSRTKENRTNKVSWEFAQLEAVTSLDPRFERAFSFGASILSVFIRDNLGAKILLETWVKRKPLNWMANYTLGHHLFFELDQYEEASKHILRASELPGAPFWIVSLGLRLLSDSGRLGQTLSQAISLFPYARDENTKHIVRTRIRAVRFEVQKKQLELALSKYSAKKGTFPKSLNQLVPYLPPPDRFIASIPTPDSIPAELKPVFNERFTFRLNQKNKSLEAVGVPEYIKSTKVFIPIPKQEERKKQKDANS